MLTKPRFALGLNELLDRGAANGHEQDAARRTIRRNARWHGWLGPSWIGRLQRALRAAGAWNKPAAVQLRLHEPRNAPRHGERRMPDDGMRDGDSALGENQTSETTV